MKLVHPLPWNRDSGIGVGVAFGRVPRYPGGWHAGIDMHAPVGESVQAAAPGKVVYADDTEGDYGLRIDIEHDGFYTIYAHLDEIYVVVGDTVEAGEEIAACGNTANSRGPHLHFEVREGLNESGKVVDPMEWIHPRPSYYHRAWLRSD